MQLTKILSLLLVLVMLLSAVACDMFGNDAESENANETTATEAKETTAKEEEPSDEEEDPSDEEEETTTKEEETTTKEEESTTKEEESTANIQTITIAEALELCGEPGNKTTERYYIRATIKSISNSQYGSMVIYDETGEISVYGTYSADGSKYFNELDPMPNKGDEVLLYCILQNYNGTKEVQNARLIELVPGDNTVDLTQYKNATIAEARAAEVGEKLIVSGTVAGITYANGHKPSGVVLVNGADSIYVYSNDLAGRVKVGSRVEVAASKTYWILETEQSNAAAHGYKGCNQLEDVTVISVTDGEDNWTNGPIPTTTIKEIMDTPFSTDITTQVFKTTALVTKAPGNGFTNYYLNDLDETTGSYVYTQCNGNDFAWIDAFDGKICTVYFMVINAKSEVKGCTYRFLPLKIVDENYTFDTNDTAAFVTEYHGATQFAASYTGNPALELKTSVSSALLGFENATLSYASSDESVIKIEVVDGKPIMNCLKTGTATIAVTGFYGGISYSTTVTVTVDIPTEEIPSVNVKAAIDAAVGEEVTVKGIVGPSLVNQTGFYLIDESGVIAVCMTEEELAKVQLGQEIILKGTRATRTKGGANYFGQTNLDACEILVNNYGSHDYSTTTFIEGKTAADFYALNVKEDHGTEVYVITVTVEVVETAYYTNMKLTSGSTSISLYCSSASQYSFLKAYAGQEVTVEIAPCNWNDKSYYAGCVLAVRNADGTKTYNELNFSK